MVYATLPTEFLILLAHILNIKKYEGDSSSRNKLLYVYF